MLRIIFEIFRGEFTYDFIVGNDFLMQTMKENIVIFD
jgi:hypothetical protein